MKTIEHGVNHYPEAIYDLHFVKDPHNTCDEKPHMTMTLDIHFQNDQPPMPNKTSLNVHKQHKRATPFPKRWCTKKTRIVPKRKPLQTEFST